jgi:DNA-binding transcriptional ArsR family regulator
VEVSVVGVLPGPATEQIDLLAVLAALSDPVRLDIVAELANVPEAPCGRLGTGTGVAKSTRTHHLRVLREAGVIAMRAEGTYKYSRLRRDDLNERFPGLIDSVLAAAPPRPAGRPSALDEHCWD